MKKTYQKIALIAAVVMAAASMSVVALAAEEESRPDVGDAGIKFEAGLPPAIVDPDIQGLHSSDIHFGDRKITVDYAEYKSVENNKDGDELKYAGVAVQNEDPYNNSWIVSVTISNFEYVDAPDIPCMEGFTMDLLKKTVEGEVEGVLGSGTTAPEASDIADLKAGPQNGARVFTSAADGSVGKWGQNYAGTLKVLGGTALEEGEAQATITWTIGQVPVQP